MRRTALLLIACGHFHLPAQAAMPAPACGVERQMFDSKDVLCTIPSAAEVTRYEFVARFSGGHDDTSASIQTSLDDRPLACEPGSKKDLFAEDGNVSLYCRFAVPAGSGDAARLRIAIAWSHAQFTDFRLEAR